MIHVFGLEVAFAVLVQIPAMEPMSAVRAPLALAALTTLIALATGVPGVPVVSLGALWTHRAVIAAVSLGTLRTHRPVIFNDPARTEMSPLSLHDALPIWAGCAVSALAI